MRAIVAGALFFGLTGATLAQQPSYNEQVEKEFPALDRLVKGQPYKSAYAALLKELSPVPDYLSGVLKRKGDYMTFGSKQVSVDGSPYRVAMVCPTNVTCAEYGSVFLFTADGRQGWAEIRDGDKPVYLGGPNAAQKQALDQAFDE
ncbi:hypothetical protein FZC33_10305 [Labrys sp. KNU-23]|uniref:hypothetical protein n=1 Tax=Labrys sp. KNU-23 TaxID=2789216 RepID=UPI0011EF3095|nr:hypothetical protein [Labrys sp. KNU-23]QEN86698.1 hypothetical protein FZC33_10305 [Labrys sp. KNU-23]